MSREAVDPAPWYRDGLRFRCTACGHCCTGVPGYVWVTEEEIERMARFKGLSVARFSREHVRRVGKRFSLIERKNGDCVMLKDGKCSVYAVKPVPCSTFPFWEGPLANKDAWNETAARCEGIGQGDLYPLADIQRILAGDPAPLLERHAAAPAGSGSLARIDTNLPSVGSGSLARIDTNLPSVGRLARGLPAAPVGSTSSGSDIRVDSSLAPYPRESSTQLPPANPGRPPPSARDSSTQPPPASASAPPEPGSLTPPPPAWSAALADLEALYAELDAELPRHRMTCVASGDCCDFDRIGHRLYVSTLEAEWFFRNSPDPRVNANERHCPAWGADRFCKARVGRMLGCRTYHCGPYPGSRPDDVHEPYHQRVKALHDTHGIPYQYRDILDWSKERRPVAAPQP